MQKLQKALEHFGLDEKQAQVYLASLQIGEASASQIARRAEIKRSTTYVKLDELNIKGLIEIRNDASKTIYRAVPPQRLKQIAEYRVNELEEVLPELRMLHKNDPDKPRIQIFEGINAVEQAYEEFFGEIPKKAQLLVFGTLDHVETDPFKPYMEKWMSILEPKKIETLELINAEEIDNIYMQRSLARAHPLQQFRVTEGMDFASDNFIFQDKMLIFAVREHIYVTIIEDKDIVASYRKLFMMAWESATPIEEYKK